MRIATAMAPTMMLNCSQYDPVSASGHCAMRSQTTPHAHNPWRAPAISSDENSSGQ